MVQNDIIRSGKYGVAAHKVGDDGRIFLPDVFKISGPLPNGEVFIFLTLYPQTQRGVRNAAGIDTLGDVGIDDFACGFGVKFGRNTAAELTIEPIADGKLRRIGHLIQKGLPDSQHIGKSGFAGEFHMVSPRGFFLYYSTPCH